MFADTATEGASVDWIVNDLEQCQVCAKCFDMSTFCSVVVTEDKPAAERPEKRYFVLCPECRERCRHDAKFESEVTKIVFREKLGRRIRTK